ncbi:hypothetical protein Goe24_01740 [Bacillus phage vB_BsuM-Goe24]|uniref:Uncharacterized protein n=1 Tax=Bacillus phage vB_BsuM-Goe3 TaxID=1933063 RepID=A0A217ERA8_BPGO3|nr:hypothetical protein HWB07_gp137 [Bacillus phage vB_BsuM-Goe3]APZ82633.1 hypothetical protein Goe3_c17200 [Bacillus phage vB_BsuM-Goe3]QDP43200.1 hypothetical protein Goe7_c01750 [Bacillus phage vB_BveM-Goe7]WCS69549.1 hypothetical protein Goe24_01740 [Bacillus phage vB_BsuM-Goe24]
MTTVKSKKNNRRTLYLSDRKDKDILDYIQPLVGDRFDFSFVIRELVRDGIKYRSNPVAAAAPTAPQAVYQESSIQSNTPDLSNIALQKKELSDEDIEDRLDSF